MKYLFLLLMVAVSTACSAQKVKDSVKITKDTTATKPLTQDDPLLSYSDYSDFVGQVLADVPMRYADVIREWFIQRLRQKAALLKKKK